MITKTSIRLQKSLKRYKTIIETHVEFEKIVKEPQTIQDNTGDSGRIRENREEPRKIQGGPKDSGIIQEYCKESQTIQDDHKDSGRIRDNLDQYETILTSTRQYRLL